MESMESKNHHWNCPWKSLRREYVGDNRLHFNKPNPVFPLALKLIAVNSVKELFNLFGILCRRFVSSLPFSNIFNHLFTSVWIHTHIYFILWAITQHHLILWLKLFQFWPLRAPSAGSCTRDTSLPVWGFLFFTLAYFLAQDAPALGSPGGSGV